MRLLRRLSSLLVLASALAPTLTLARPATAAQTTWADPAGLCNGNAPCFTAVADAVANAGPAPAEVFLFPGTYPESVDLGTMGSALPGGMPGELSVVSVDAAGQPAPGAVIDPGAMGGPGTGPAIAATAFPGALTLDGLVVRSPDNNGIFLVSSSAPVTLSNLDASNCPAGNGAVVANQAGVVRLEASEARLNFNAGFALASEAGTVEVVDSVSERNNTGFSLVARSVSVADSRSDINDTEGWLIVPFMAGGSLSLVNVEATSNGEGGLLAAGPLAPGLFAFASITGGEWSGNASQGGLVVAESLTATQLVTDDNGTSGANFFSFDLQLSQLSATGNGDAGLAMVGGEIVASSLTAADNLGTGIFLVPLPDTTDSTLVLTGATATGNAETGVSLVVPQPDEIFATVQVSDVTADLNGEDGLVGVAEELTLSQVAAAGNGNVGVIASADRLDAELLTTTGNGGVGIGVVGEDVVLRDSVSSSNLTGFAGFGEQMLIERTTASGNGPSMGNSLDAAGFAFAAVGRLDAVDAVAELNEVGWAFPPFPMPFGPSAPSASGAFGRAVDRFVDVYPDLADRLLGGGAPPLQQRITILSSRTEGNSTASMDVTLLEGAIFRVGCSDFVANGPSGLQLQTDNVVDARSNFWGDASGPTHPGNPVGAGDLILDAASGAMGSVFWDPFLAVPATPVDCPQPPAVEVPALDAAGLTGLALLLAAAALGLLRRRRGSTRTG